MADSDYLIVGAGAAGAVLAARLTENPLITVVLAEAGRDLVPGREPADVMSLFPLSTFNGAYAWPGLEAHWLTAADSPALPFAQGRVVGGSSTIMGMWAVRGVPNDYDDWARAGANGWGWTDVLPFFRKLETDCDFDGPLHGQDGPLPIRRQPKQCRSPRPGVDLLTSTT
jgi:5-(hydroxymethyl)furfural/furfural oxidase